MSQGESRPFIRVWYRASVGGLATSLVAVLATVAIGVSHNGLEMSASLTRIYLGLALFGGLGVMATTGVLLALVSAAPSLLPPPIRSWWIRMEEAAAQRQQEVYLRELSRKRSGHQLGTFLRTYLNGGGKWAGMDRRQRAWIALSFALIAIFLVSRLHTRGIYLSVRDRLMVGEVLPLVLVLAGIFVLVPRD